MLVFVDFVGLKGEYKEASAPSWIHPTMPIEVITGAVFLDAQLATRAARIRRLYHVERGEMIDVARLAESLVAPLDTLIVVNSDDPVYANSDVLDRAWQRVGGAFRRLEHSGMPARQRQELARYAQ